MWYLTFTLIHRCGRIQCERTYTEVRMTGENGAAKLERIPTKTDIVVKWMKFAVVLASVAAYGIYIWGKKMNLNFETVFLPALTWAFFSAVLIAAMPKIIRTLCGRTEYPRPLGCDYSKNFWRVVLIALGIRVVSTIIGMIVFKLINPTFSEDLLSLWRTAWMKENNDGQHYLNIAENWYVNEGNDKLLIVFFPMFPVLIRIFNFVIGNSFVSAQVINTIAECLACGMLFKVFADFMDERRAKFGAIIAVLLPGAVFMNSAMTEPLFILLSACCLYFAGRERFLLAGLFAALSGFTRSVGILLVIPIAMEGIRAIVYDRKNGYIIWKRILVVAAALVISTLGTLAYLGINYQVSGNPLIFTVYQKMNWSQGIGLFYDTPRYMFVQLNSWIVQKNWVGVAALWLPSLLVIFGSLALYFKEAKRMPASHTAYFLSYYVITIGCTWLLSAVRYMAAAIPLIGVIGLSCKTKAKTIIIYAAAVLVYLLWIGFYMARTQLY